MANEFLIKFGYLEDIEGMKAYINIGIKASQVSAEWNAGSGELIYIADGRY